MTTQLETKLDVLKDVSGDALTSLHRGIEAIGGTLSGTLSDTFGHPAPPPPASHKGRWLLLAVLVLGAVGAVLFVRSRRTETPSSIADVARDERAA